ncbi:orotidine-5'-phosphate decarboxylase [candidate division KSB1 bacterium]|nr:orotidine-5'-phosphate decarboxylase [candidate division KSB1 bacterium]
MRFNDRLEDVCKHKNSCVCVGLDLDIAKIPSSFLREKQPLYVFAREIINVTSEYAAAYKLNTAFYEATGVEGWRLLSDIVDMIPGDTIRIADAKRADIGNTSKMYAQAFFSELPFDAVTVNPYLGFDGIAPFIEREDKGVFILCLTSNPGAQDFQYLNHDGVLLYEQVALKAREWNRLNNCCLVVGATHEDELRQIRRLVPDIPFLIPGIGAQGGDLELSVRYSFESSTTSSLFNSSRGILYSSEPEDYMQRVAERCKALRDEINRFKNISME